MRQMLAIVMLLGALLATPASAQDERVFDLTGDWKDANGKATTFSQFLDDKGARIVVVRSADCRDPLSETCLEFRGPITGSKLALTHKITAGTVGGLYGPLAPEVKTQVVGKLEVTLDGEIVDEGERIVARLQIPQFSVDKKTGALVDKGTKPVKTSFSARARLLVRESHEQSSASNRNLPGVTEDQPFYVDLRVPRVDAKRVGDFAEIEFLVKDTGKTTHLRLGSQNAAYRGTVVYTTPSTITIQGGGEGAGKDGALGNLFSSMAGGLAPGNMFGLKVPNGGIVVITYKDATTTASTEVRVFHSRTKLALGLCQSALDDLYTLYGRMLSQWADRLTPDGSKALRSKMRAIENERRIIEFEPKETDKYHFFFADTTRLKACEGYFQYVLSDPATWNAGDPREYSGGGVGFKGPDVRFPGVDYEAWRESQIVGFAIRDGEEMWKTIAWKSIADLTIDLYQVYIGITLADQLWIAVDGTNPVTGKRVDLSERVMAGVGFASNVALGVLGGQALKDRQATWAGERPGFTGDPGPAHSKPGDWVSKTNPDGTKPRGLSEGSAIKPLESPRAPTPRNNPILTPGTPENKAYFGGIADEAKGRTPEGGRPTGEARPTPEPAKPTAPAPTPAAEPVKPAEPAKPTMTGEAPPPSEQPKPPSSSDSGGLMGKVGSGEKPNEPLGGVGGGSEPPRTTKLPPPEMPEPAPTGTTKLPPPEMPEPAPPKTTKLPAPEMPEPAPPKTTKLPAPEMPEPAPPKTTKLPAPEMPEPAPPKTTKLPAPEMPEPAPPKTTKLPAPEMPEPAPPKTTKLPTPEMPEPAPPKTTKLPAPEMPEPAPPKTTKLPAPEMPEPAPPAGERPPARVARPGGEPPPAVEPAAKPPFDPNAETLPARPRDVAAVGAPRPPEIVPPERAGVVPGEAAPRPVEPAAAGKPARAPPAPGEPGSIQRPLQGNEILADARDLTGRTIQLPPSADGTSQQPLTLGRRLGGDGKYGYVYAVEGEGRAVKIIHNASGGGDSVKRQVAGFKAIENNPDIAAPRITAYNDGSAGHPPYIVVENLNEGVWKAKQVSFYDATKGLSPEQIQAMRDLYGALAKSDHVWIDGHANNVFFYQEGGRLKAGVLDHDYIVPPSQLADEQIMSQARANYMGGPGMRPVIDTMMGKQPSAQEIMDAFARHRFGNAPERIAASTPATVTPTYARTYRLPYADGSEQAGVLEKLGVKAEFARRATDAIQKGVPSGDMDAILDRLTRQAQTVEKNPALDYFARNAAHNEILERAYFEVAERGIKQQVPNVRLVSAAAEAQEVNAVSLKALLESRGQAQSWTPEEIQRLGQLGRESDLGRYWRRIAPGEAREWEFYRMISDQEASAIRAAAGRTNLRVTGAPPPAR